jgi:hypothetical protein
LTHEQPFIKCTEVKFGFAVLEASAFAGPLAVAEFKAWGMIRLQFEGTCGGWDGFFHGREGDLGYVFPDLGSVFEAILGLGDSGYM